MSTIGFNTSRLLVRSVQAHESQAYGVINELRGNPQDWDADWVEWNSRSAIQLFIILRGYYSNSGAPTTSEGTVVGFIKIAGNRNEVSFRTHPSFRGQGFMKEAVRATFTQFFQLWPTRELFVETMSDNWPVIRMMEGFGLRGHSGGWSSVGSVSWSFGWATWRYAR